MFLKYILSEMKKYKKFNIRNIEQEIEKYQNKILKQSKVKVVYETMKINDYEIRFPNIEYSDYDLIKICIKNTKQYPDFEDTFSAT